MRYIKIDIEQANKIGLKEAIILQIIEEKIKESTTALEGIVWEQLSTKDIGAALPFFSLSTIKRTITNLRNMKLINIKGSSIENGMKGKNLISIRKEKE